jgi:chromosome partitioning protein
MYEVLTQGVPLAKAVQPTNTPGLFVATANANLAGAEIELVQADKREYRLREVLKDAGYGYVLIDCPPSLGLLTVNALTAANSVLMPVQAEYYALEGLSQLLETLQRVRKATNPTLDLLGVLITMYDKRTSLSESVHDELKKYFNDKLLTTSIPRNVRLAEAPSYGQTIFEHDRWSKGARAYKNLAKEIKKR